MIIAYLALSVGLGVLAGGLLYDLGDRGKLLKMGVKKED